VPAGANQPAENQADQGKKQAEIRTDWRTRVRQLEKNADDNSYGQRAQQQPEQLIHRILLGDTALNLPKQKAKTVVFLSYIRWDYNPRSAAQIPE
jgi:hypothetical protein